MAGIAFAQLQTQAQLPKEVSESSGLAFDGQYLWTHNDSGNDAILYGINPDTGGVERKLYPAVIYNEDWEDLAISSDGVIFIADIGNNKFSRKSLMIYWLRLDGDKAAIIQTTQVVFPSEFTSKKGKIYFDFEALTYVNGNFYLFSKTRKDKYENATRVFEVKAVSGSQTAVYCGHIDLCKKERNCKITAAAYNNKNDQLALLSHKNVWIIESFDPQNLNATESHRYEFDKATQKEGVTFKDDNSLYITEERNKGKQRLYLLNLKQD